MRLHYRLWQYNEPIYFFGVLWAGYFPAGAKRGEPMHDAYDAFWAWKDFRGRRVQSNAELADKRVSEKLLEHLQSTPAAAPPR